MMKPMPVFMLAILSAMAAPAIAQDAPRASVDGATFAKRLSDRMMAADADGDGRISAAEWAAGGRAGAAANPARTRRFAMLDANKDGFLDRAEITATVAARLRRVDGNGDGRIDATERAAARPARTPAAATAD